MKINPTKIYNDTCIKYCVCIFLIAICIASLFLISCAYIYIPAILLIGLIYQAVRYVKRINRFVFMHGIQEIDTNEFFRSAEPEEKAIYEDIGFF